jgi:hypothetical protein
MAERRLQHREPVAATAGRAGKIDDERRAAEAGESAGEQGMRGRVSASARIDSAMPGASRSITVEAPPA